MRFWAKTAGIVVALGLAIQFVRPSIEPSPEPAPTTAPAAAELQAPAEVRAILRHSCYNCHSNETQLSWFDQPAPAYWLVAHDVKEARRHLNFSEIGKLPAAAQRGMLFEAVNQIRLGAMPLPSYRQAHPGSAVTAEQLAVLENYLAPFGAAAGPSPATPSAGSDVGEMPKMKMGVSIRSILPELNGLPFFSGYESWKPISTTDRGDNHTLRMILGNDAAVKAIAAKTVTPWPDGSAFAKVAWEAAPDGNGGLAPGKFIQVEFMVKDARKYASTAGWGWGRWRGWDLKPYGKDAHFDGECVSCHRPVRGNDYVYTLPVDRGNERGGQ